MLVLEFSTLLVSWFAVVVLAQQALSQHVHTTIGHHQRLVALVYLLTTQPGNVAPATVGTYNACWGFSVTYTVANN